jgi:hypothetical protein
MKGQHEKVLIVAARMCRAQFPHIPKSGKIVTDPELLEKLNQP